MTSTTLERTEEYTPKCHLCGLPLVKKNEFSGNIKYYQCPLHKSVTEVTRDGKPIDRKGNAID